MEIRFFGEKVPTLQNYKWYPNEVTRHGSIHGVEIATSTILVPGERAGLVAINLENKTKQTKVLPIQFNIRGGIDYVPEWGFSRPITASVTHAVENSNTIVRKNDAGSIAISTNIPGLKWFDLASHWDSQITLAAGAQKTYYVTVATGKNDDPVINCKEIMENPKEIIKNARQACEAQLEDVFSKIPRFTASNKSLEKFYNRSLLHLFFTKWEVPEFILQPYYGSGSVIGGCVANYLWEFGIPAELFPLYDPKAAKEHIKQFMKIDITKHFLFGPMTGKADGPWYPINQTLIIKLIYFYVLHTGDTAFLDETVNGKTVLDYAINCAMFGDDKDKPVALYDYGAEGEHHLELRRGFPYQGVMPDLNGRRYESYLWAFKLSEVAGRTASFLPNRAQELKVLLKNQLWNAENKWFDFEINGKKDTRWLGLMFMLINNGVLDKEEETGLLTHLNSKEFLGSYGLHSISKIDPAYDQVDIDNGGGGCYTAFVPMICQRLYLSGNRAAADDLLQRILWWGERVPYWGDSFVANYIGYRDDTPLQGDFSAIAGAQSIIFGMFGVNVNSNGDITINPYPPSFSPQISLYALKLRKVAMNIIANQDSFSVEVNGKVYQSKIGKPIVIPGSLQK
ncbi:MAG: hypothetical protein J0H29_23660 [Sphingobacteriales bacterium]|nr:hypothetical protein [Sphingobacteriales bacterium]